jgi:hypothetical protein
MGIRYLNSFLKKTCRNSIRIIHLEELSNKRIVIDASIYLYQFEGDGFLIDNMKRFINVLREYKIYPLFVFDGKPPAEKMDTIYYRREKRKEAALECIEVSNRIQDETLIEEERQQLEIEYDKLRRSSVEITRNKTDMVKKLFDEEKIAYCIAPSEADTICASMVMSNGFWGCMSDDMDMLVYGCNNILRDLNIDNHTARLYVLPDILKELNITYDNFKRICVISGTDYNHYHQHHQKHIVNNIESTSVVKWKNNYVPNNITFYTAIKLFARYQHTVKYPTMTFYSWLKHYLKLNIDYVALDKVYNMFCIEHSNYMSIEVAA